MSMSELMTAVRHDIPVTSIVFHNRQWGAEKKNQVDFYGRRFVAGELEGGENYSEIAKAMGAEGVPEKHLEGYGVGIEDRLTGAHETQRFDQFSYGVSDRGASIRIPWQVAQDQKGYIEDRRPNANADPYVVATLLTNTIGAALAG